MNTTHEATSHLNGVDVERLMGTIKAIEQDPSLGHFEFRAQNRWIHGGHNQSVIQGFYGAGQEDTSRRQAFVLDNDEPDVLLGKDNGANPAEYVLHALAGCMTTTIAYHAAARGIRIQALECTLSGDIDLRGMLGISRDVPAGYTNIRAEFRVKGDLTHEQLEELRAIAVSYSPVHYTVSNPVRLDVQVTAK